jgi:murein DD-endopeptidase MepM/ murein hydrolase activator NlpD
VYGHLAGVADGVREGAHVERGQVIGYVGSSGLSTGPHLHFALGRDGEYVDPMHFTAGRAGATMSDGARRAFERVQLAVTRQLSALPKTERPLPVSLSSTAYRPE